MTDPRDLLQSTAAPAPFARPMPTEVRTEAGLQIKVLQSPSWAGPNVNPVIAEMACSLSLSAIVKLREYLVTPDAQTGMLPEAAIDAALKAHGIGSYLGTFVAAGPNFHRVRFVFGYTPKSLTSHEDLNTALYDLLQDKNASNPQGAAALRYIRGIWSQAEVRTDEWLMMLSQIDLMGELSNPARSPFVADTLASGGTP